jgi:hypothetical protein
MQNGRAKVKIKCKMVEPKNVRWPSKSQKKNLLVEQKNARWSSKSPKQMPGGRAKK